MSNPSDRQCPLYIHDEITKADFTAAAVANTIEYDVPPNTTVISASTDILTVFDGTTPTIDVGYVGSLDVYLANTDATALGGTVGSGAELGQMVPSGNKIRVTWVAGAGATEVGEVRVAIGYVVADRSTETQD